MRVARKLCIASLVLVVGCATGVSDPASQPDPLRPQPIGSSTTTRLATTTTSTATTTTTTGASPIIELFTSATGGYTPSEIWTAVEAQRQEFTRECVEAEGWTVDESILPPLPIEQESPSYFGGVVDQFRSILEQMDSDGESVEEAEPLPDEFWVRFDQCSVSAVDTVADPRDALFEWLAQNEEDMAAQFVASPGYVDAEQDFNRCIQATGYDVADPNEASNQIFDRATELIDKYQRGDMSKADARDALVSLAAEEQTMGEAFTPCYEAKTTAEQAIWTAVERAFLDAHGDALAIGLAEAAESVQALLETLRDRERNS